MTVTFFDWLFGRKKPNPQAGESGDELSHWRIAKITGPDGRVVVARVRLQRPDLADLDKYTTAVHVSWPLAGNPIPSSMSPEDLAATGAFEDAMADFESFSYLIQVRTGLGERNWLFYSSDSDALTNGIATLQAANGWPLTVRSHPDPSWSEWRLLAERITGKKTLH